MSKHRQDTEDGHLPLPTPHSPRELDERILAHARANAPEKRPLHTVGWLGGMATTAVLVVAIYLTSTTGTNQGLPQPAPAALKEERAAAPMASQPRARLKATADFDAPEPAAVEDKELQMAPMAEATFDNAGARAMQRADDPGPNLPGSLQHLQELLISGDDERAHREYEELRNACAECDLPDTLEEALERLKQRNSAPP